MCSGHRTLETRERTRPRRHASAGYSLLEMMIALAISGIVVSTAVTGIKSTREQVTVAQRTLIANLRRARWNAIIKNVHYAVAFPTTTQIVVERMQLLNGQWQVDSSDVRTITLPSGTQLGPSSGTGKIIGTTVEFNTRGMVVNLTQVEQINITDTFQVTKSLQAWPSGQINDL